VKVVSLGKVREKGLEELLNREIRLLKELKHENVISCHDVLMTANNCYIVTEYCPQGDLAALLTKKGRLPL
jgi:serine/threonine protein kinase